MIDTENNIDRPAYSPERRRHKIFNDATRAARQVIEATATMRHAFTSLRLGVIEALGAAPFGALEARCLALLMRRR